MKYLLAIAVGLCLTGCATTSKTQSTSQQQGISDRYGTTVFMPDGAYYTFNYTSDDE